MDWRYQSGIIIFLLLFSMPNYIRSQQSGCTFNSGTKVATCTFGSVTFPIDSSAFSSPPCAIIINTISGSIPANSLSSVTTCPDTSVTDPLLQFACSGGGTIDFASGAFSGGSIAWITQISIQNCVVTNGFPANTFATLTGLTSFLVDSGSVGTVVDGSLAGLSSLNAFTFQSTFTTGTFSSGFFKNTPAITKLSMPSAGLTSIPSGGFSGLTSLTNLDLSSNLLTTLPADLFLDLTSAASITLTGNAWECTCDLAWLVQWELYSGIHLH